MLLVEVHSFFGAFALVEEFESFTISKGKNVWVVRVSFDRFALGNYGGACDDFARYIRALHRVFWCNFAIGSVLDVPDVDVLSVTCDEICRGLIILSFHILPKDTLKSIWELLTALLCSQFAYLLYHFAILLFHFSWLAFFEALLFEQFFRHFKKRYHTFVRTCEKATLALVWACS